MKQQNRLYLIIYMAALLMLSGQLITGCSSTSALKEDEQLFTGLVPIEYKNYEKGAYADSTITEMEYALASPHRGGDVQGVVRHDADVLVRGEEVAGVRLYCTRQIHRIHRCLVSVDTNPLRGVVHRQTVATGREQRVEHVGRRAHVLFPPADAQCVCLRYVRLGALSAPVRGYDHRPTVGVRRVIEVVLHARGQYGHRTY